MNAPIASTFALPTLPLAAVYYPNAVETG